MNEITEEYLILFRAISQAEQALEELRSRLMDAQRLAEEVYISREEPEVA